MPAINPNDYNIDSFNSQNLGPITLTDFRKYVLNHNLPGINPVLQSNGITDNGLNIYAPFLFNPTESIVDLPDLTEVSFIPSPTNNNTSPRPDNKQRNIWTNEKPFYGSSTEEEAYEVTFKSLQDPGSIDSWLEEAGFETDVFSVRNFSNLTNNQYGPEFVEAYNDPNEQLESTGYLQYPTSSGGDVIGPIIARSLGFSPENFIQFPSPLEDNAKERRIEELKNRVLLNFVDDTVGKLNLDPLGLLAGQSVFTPNYTITRRKGFLGKAAEFAANLTGFNFPRSIIPGKDNVDLGSNAFQEDLLDYTGKAQRKLLYKNVYSSKYTPETLTKGYSVEDSNQDAILAKGPEPNGVGKKKPNNYLRLNKKKNKDESTRQRRVGNFFNDLVTPGDQSLIPEPEKLTNPNDPFINMGVDGQYPAIEGLDPESTFVNPEIEQPSYDIKGGTVEYFPNNTTLRPTQNDNDDPNNTFTHQTPSTRNLFYWQARRESISKRGLIEFTQNMINNADSNGYRGGAKAIGRYDSGLNIISAEVEATPGSNINVPRLKDVSKGNLVRSEDNDYYCRSWSTRNPYQNNYDLIRRDKLYRAGGGQQSGPFPGPYQSTLEETGHVKIAPNISDINSIGSTRDGTTINTGEEVKRYMFSIENMAWADAPQKIGLEPCELGPNGGRIMWFPPYDINFTDNTTANWDSTVFLGRAEPIYTYNHTERKGTLSWTILTDHPSVLNELKKESEDEIYKFFAGCGMDITEFFDKEVEEIIEEETWKEIQITEEIEPLPIKPVDIPPTPEPKEPPVKELSFYYRNATSDYGKKGRSGSGVPGRTIDVEVDVNYDTGTFSSDGVGQNKISQTKNGDYLMLNQNNWFTTDGDETKGIDALIDFLATDEGQNWCVEFNGYCSAASTNNYNELLSIDRAERAYQYVAKKVKERGETGGTGYTYNATNFAKTNYGYKCLDGKDGKGVTGNISSGLPESDYYKKNLPNIDLTKCSETISAYSNKKGKKGYWWVGFNQIPTPTSEEEKSKFRWSVIANSEDGAAQTDADGLPLESEQTTGRISVGTKSRSAKEDRRVILKLFRNHEYMKNNATIDNNPDEVDLLGNQPVRLDVIKPELLEVPGVPSSFEIPTISGFNNEPLTIRVDANGNPVVWPPPLQITTPPTRREQRLARKEEKNKTLSADTTNINPNTSTDKIIENANEEQIKKDLEGGAIGEDVNDAEVNENPETKTRTERQKIITQKTVKRTVQRLFRECQYFEKIKRDDPFLYETINEKITNFHPAFHSITPEGLNSRLTFLHQCMRQGPSLTEQTNQTQNMAFGRPPILVLRIGDFYYTKIVPDSLNINYEPLQWDMNPEGVGVQPMIAKVDLNFSIIGGSSLDGPIKQLQNAVSFNFFANTSIYNPRRYYDNQTSQYSTLEQKLAGDVVSSLPADTISYGAFKNQQDANADSQFAKNPQLNLVKESDTEAALERIDAISNEGPMGIEPLPIIPAGLLSTEIQPTDIQPTRPLTEAEAAAEAAALEFQGPFLLQNEGLMGTQEDQDMIKAMYPGARTPSDDINTQNLFDSLDIGVDNLPAPTNIQDIADAQLFKYPNGSDGIILNRFLVETSDDAQEFGYVMNNDVDLTLTYPDGTVTKETTRAYSINKTLPLSELIEFEKGIEDRGENWSVWQSYTKLNTGNIGTVNTFEVQRFFNNWFLYESFQNGVHKLEVTWRITREVTESTIEPGTEQKVGQLISQDRKETFTYDLYSPNFVIEGPVV